MAYLDSIVRERRKADRSRSGHRWATAALAVALAALALLGVSLVQAHSPVPTFTGDRISSFAKIQAAPAAISEVPDPLGSGARVLEMTVSDSDVAPLTPTRNPRAQALSPALIKPGDEFWLRTEFLLPKSFPARVPGWMSLVSIYGPPFDGSSPWQVGLEGRQLSWVRNRDYGYDVPWAQPLRRGAWIELLLHERFAVDGWVEMWIDGRPVRFFSGGTYNPSHHRPTERLRMRTVDRSNGGAANAAKIMQYRKRGMFRRATVYFSGLTLGATRESVEP